MQISNYFFTISQTAKLLDTTRQTISNWVREGKFNTQHIGREVLIPRNEIKKLLGEKLKHIEGLYKRLETDENKDKGANKNKLGC